MATTFAFIYKSRCQHFMLAPFIFHEQGLKLKNEERFDMMKMLTMYNYKSLIQE